MSEKGETDMKDTTDIRALFRFIEASPTSFHAVHTMERVLEREGYARLLESEAWELRAGGRYYVTRNGSALLAFRIPEHMGQMTEKNEARGFRIVASHSDSPCLKIKENPELAAAGDCVKLNVEKYGGMLCATWFDRPLSVAGRLLTEEGSRIVTRLVDVRRDLVLIPSLAIHMNREANKGYEYHVQKDMLPLYGMETEDGRKPEAWTERIAREAGVDPESILGSDLFLYSRTPTSIWGADGEFMSAGRLDDLECVYASLKSFLTSEEADGIPVHCVYDNEEVGSSTRQGAASTFLADTLLRISEAFGGASAYRRMLAHSMMLSADNAHAVHPNYPEEACPSNRPLMNRGIVIKFSGNQRYTSDGVSAAIFRSICRRAQVPIQIFTNHSDVAGGSTLGNISAAQVPVPCVDIGLAQLAMHSAYETAGARDLEYMIRGMKAFYETALRETGAGEYELSGGRSV